MPKSRHRVYFKAPVYRLIARNLAELAMTLPGELGDLVATPEDALKIADICLRRVQYYLAEAERAEKQVEQHEAMLARRRAADYEKYHPAEKVPEPPKQYWIDTDPYPYKGMEE